MLSIGKECMQKFIAKIAKKYNCDKTRLLDVFWEIQRQHRYVSEQALEFLSLHFQLSVAELKDTLTFYHFFHTTPAGQHRIYLDKSVVAKMFGAKEIRQAFEQELGIQVGEVTADGKIGLYTTDCIGMSDQQPAALIAGVPVGNLTPKKVHQIVAQLKKSKPPKVSIQNCVQQSGPVFFDNYAFGKALTQAMSLSADEILEEIELSNLRGRGGAGFSTGMKWKVCANQSEAIKYVVCNADEGEPGTFKDRFLITKKAAMLIEGMAIAARAIGAQAGFIYLRAEYHYLQEHLQKQIEKYCPPWFKIRIQMGAGAYVVGEETALLESMEGRRGEPRIRPPFPVEQGYLGKPTIVNNVETFCAVTKIIQYGALWYVSLGTEKSSGTKLLSVSGDCRRPGIYEVEWGLKIDEFLQLVGANPKTTQAVQIGGPSGTCLNTARVQDRHRTISFEDLPTGGSMIVIGKQRHLLEIVKDFTKFFVAESCGCCVPCRAGGIVLKEQIEQILRGEAASSDLQKIKDWSKIINATSRCGLGQTCSNPLTFTIENFPKLYQKLMGQEKDFEPFDVDEKTQAYDEFVSQYD